MRPPSTEDENEDIMDTSEAFDKATEFDDYQLFLENETMAAVKKAPAKTATATDKPLANPVTPAASAKKTKAAKAAPEAPAEKAKGVFGPRVIPEGHTGIATLATEFETTPAVIRRKLRGIEGLAKPEGQHGWYWKDNSKDLAAVRKALAPAKA